LRPYISCHSAVFLFLVSHSFFLSLSLSFLLSFLFLYLSFCLSLSLFILLWLSLCLSHSVCHVSLSQDLSLTLKLSLSFLSRLGISFPCFTRGSSLGFILQFYFALPSKSSALLCSCCARHLAHTFPFSWLSYVLIGSLFHLRQSTADVSGSSQFY
jgi:hypothetical protein